MSLQGSFRPYRPASGAGAMADQEHTQHPRLPPSSDGHWQAEAGVPARRRARPPPWISEPHSQFESPGAQQASCWAVKSFQTNLCVYRDSRAAGNISEYQSGRRTSCICAKLLSTPAIALGPPFPPHPSSASFSASAVVSFALSHSGMLIVKSFKNHVKPKGVKWNESNYLSKWKGGQKEEKERVGEKRSLGGSAGLATFLSVLKGRWRQTWSVIIPWWLQGSSSGTFPDLDSPIALLWTQSVFFNQAERIQFKKSGLRPDFTAF